MENSIASTCYMFFYNDGTKEFEGEICKFHRNNRAYKNDRRLLFDTRRAYFRGNYYVREPSNYSRFGSIWLNLFINSFASQDLFMVMEDKIIKEELYEVRGCTYGKL